MLRDPFFVLSFWGFFPPGLFFDPVAFGAVVSTSVLNTLTEPISRRVSRIEGARHQETKKQQRGLGCDNHPEEHKWMCSGNQWQCGDVLFEDTESCSNKFSGI